MNSYLVLEYTKKVGVMGVELPYYVFAKDDEEEFVEQLRALIEQGAYGFRLHMVESKPCKIKVEKQSFWYPQLGIETHLSEAMTGRSNLVRIIKSEEVNVADYIRS